MRNKNLIRSFLTTASALGMIAIGAGEASAALNTITGNATLGANGQGITTANFAATPGEDIAYDGQGDHTLALNKVNAFIRSIYTTVPANGVAPGLVTLTENTTIGSIAGDNRLAITFGDVKTLTLTGTAGAANVAANTYTGLGPVDFANNAGTIIVSSKGATFSNRFSSTGGTNGTITITGADNIFTGNIGNGVGKGVAALNVNDNTTFQGAELRATNITLAADKTMTLDSTTNAITLVGDTSGAAAGNGILVLKGTHAITHTGDIGAVNSLAGLTINTTGAGVNGSTTITGNTKISGNISVTNTNASTAKFDGTVTTVAGTGGNFDASNALGAVTVTANAMAIDGTITTGAARFTAGAAVTATNKDGADAAITIGAGGAEITGPTTATKGNIVVNNTAGNAAEFKGAVTTTLGNSGNFDASNSTGAITLGNNAHVIDGTVSTGKGLFTNTGALTVTNRANTATALTVGAGGAAGDGLVTVTRGNVVFSDVVGAGDSTYTAGMTITNGNLTTGTGAVTFNTANGLTMTAPNSEVVVGTGGLTANGVAIAFTNGGTIKLSGNRLELTGANSVVSAKGNIEGAGTIVLGNGATIEGNIGTLTTASGNIVVNTGAANQNATIGGAGSTTNVVNATSIEYQAASNLVIDSTQNNIAINATINGVGGVLTIAGGNTVTFNDAIGNIAVIDAIDATDGNVVYNNIVKATTVGVTHNNLAYSSTFNKDVTGDITFTNANDTANILANVTGDLVGGAANAGIAIFGNGTNANLSVTGIIGKTNAINNLKVNVNGGSLSATGVINVANTAFTTDGTLNVSVANSALGVVTTSTANTGTVDITAAHTLNGQVGTPALPLKEMKVAKGITLTTAANAIYAPITGAGATVNANALNTHALDMGAKGANLASITGLGAAGAITVGNLYADAITLGNNAVSAKSFNTLDTGTGTTLVANSTAIVLDGGSIGKVTANGVNGAAAGTINTSGTATLGNIGAANGRIAALNINGVSKDKVVTAGGNIYTDAMTQNGSTLKLNQDTVIDTGAGAYTVAAASALDMNGKKLTINGAAPAINAPLAVTYTYTAGDKNIITTAVAPTFTQNIGVITVAFAGGSTPADKTTLNIFGTTDGTPYAAMANAADKSVIFIADPLGRGFVDGMNFDVATGVATVSAPVTEAKFAGANGGDNEKAVAKALIAATSDDALVVFNNLKAMTAVERIQATKEIADHSSDANATLVADQAGAIAAQAASSAASSVANARLVASAEGVAAGDASERFGAWIQIIGGKGTQKERKGNAGFTSRTFGGIVGADTMISETATIGMLAANVQNNVKSSDTKAGDKSKANSWLFGLYGNTDVGSTDFFVQGNMTVAQTAVDAKDKKSVTTGAAKETARSKYDILGVGAEVVGGYKFKFDTSYVAPIVGLRYNYFGDTSYTQSGLSTGNQVVKTKATNLLSALAGIKFGATVDMDGTTIRPEVHGNVSYAFNSPSSKTTFKINGMQNSLNYVGPKAAKFGANFGGSVMAEADGFEYGIGYDANIADKYLAHQGSLKVKVKF